MKSAQLLSLSTLLLSTQALVAGPKDDSYAKRAIGLCMMGRISACNGDVVPAPVVPQGDDYINIRDVAGPTNEKREAGFIAGPCAVGMNSVCNGPRWRGLPVDSPDDSPNDTNHWLGPVAKREAGPEPRAKAEYFLGPCVVGANSPCYGPRWRGLPVDSPDDSPNDTNYWLGPVVKREAKPETEAEA